MLKIVADENIEYVKEAFSEFGNLSILSGRNISNEDLIEADILLVRSVTNVNENLLSGTKIKFVGTATIGSDHIDKNYLTLKNIFFTDAAGCNSDAVTEYVFTALFQIASEQNITLRNKTIGIVGVGNIGSRVAHIAEVLGLNILKNDPPIKRKTGFTDYYDLDQLMNADIITIHVPLIKEGIDKTHHLFDYSRLNKLKNETILINTSRGSVIDNKVLTDIIQRKKLNVILDVWENEPFLNRELLNNVNIGTPHIAGYSLEGKANGTIILYNTLCEFLKKPKTWRPQLPEVKDKIILPELKTQDSLQKALSFVYKIKEDDLKLKKINEIDEAKESAYFDSLRKNYPLRRELSNYKIKMITRNEELDKILKAFRFDVE